MYNLGSIFFVNSILAVQYGPNALKRLNTMLKNGNSYAYVLLLLSIAMFEVLVYNANTHDK